MAQGTLTEWPALTYAGDSILVQVSTDDYHYDDSWTMTYQFRRDNGSLISVDSTAAPDGSTDHWFSVLAATTATWIPGQYDGIAYVTNSDTSQRAQIWRGVLEIKPDYAQQLDSSDQRSWAKRCLDKIEAVIEGRATKEILTSSIAGVSIGRLTPDQLFAMRDKFRSEYDEELAAIADEHGLGTGKDIYVRFNTPTS